MKNKESKSRFEEANNIPPIKDPSEERQKTSTEIDAAYNTGLNYYQENHLELAEKELVKVLKPVLSKPEMQSLYVNIDDCKDKLLDAMYHLGKIYLESPYHPNHHAKAAAIFQYCAGFAKKYDITNSDIDFLQEAYLVETKFLASIGRDNGSATSTISDYQQEIAEYKQKLAQVRAVAKEKLAAIDSLNTERIAERARAVEDLYKECTSFFVNNDNSKNSNNNNNVKEGSPGLIQQLLKSL